MNATEQKLKKLLTDVLRDTATNLPTTLQQAVGSSYAKLLQQNFQANADLNDEQATRIVSKTYEALAEQIIKVLKSRNVDLEDLLETLENNHH